MIMFSPSGPTSHRHNFSLYIHDDLLGIFIHRLGQETGIGGGRSEKSGVRRCRCSLEAVWSEHEPILHLLPDKHGRLTFIGGLTDAGARLSS
jgi:hypothetical protein